MSSEEFLILKESKQLLLKYENYVPPGYVDSTKIPSPRIVASLDR